MQSRTYSASDFDPYGDRQRPENPELWPAPVADGPLDAVVALPGSKSLTNRELVLSALADGPSTLTAPLHSQDSDRMVEALAALGTRIERVPSAHPFGADLRISPADELLGSTTIDCGQAGTVMRFTPPLAALALGPTTFDADPSAVGRPMHAMIEALRALGVDLADEGRGSLPFTVHGTGSVEGGEITIDASASSQFVSGLLLSAPRFERGLVLHHSGQRLPSLPHIEMTIATLAARGVTVETPAPGTWSVAPQPIRGRDVAIEPDLSNAAPFLAAAVATGGRVTITGWPESTTQVGADLATLLLKFGASVTRDGDRLTVTGGPSISGVELDLSTGGELAPALVALAALADSPSEITGIGHIRHHETDRLAALAAEVNGLGGSVTELPDGLRIEPRPLHGGVWRSHKDHRMSTAGALIGLVTPGVEVHDIGATAKTLPEFPELWHGMLEKAYTP
ncbi:3-phosphoshikimate 1-carboxyvinyltransferase [Gryllotalpicola ginsengisoli]|uniref:3-phosphoshikimate 1-carboxyvinyltransferase n=1 Tax=Gryllotalpicola ginsengisoli TaxID=444608 RepID=UPI0003B51688|nr:3-phosphoshikimate 1-carboxyvinyltransferase [Gryllotalpicola ginsengisoli]